MRKTVALHVAPRDPPALASAARLIHYHIPRRGMVRLCHGNAAFHHPGSAVAEGAFYFHAQNVAALILPGEGIPTGLGLFIARSIAERHGGRIHVGTGLKGKGASFTVRFAVKDNA